MGLLQKERVLTYPDTPKTILTQRSIYKLTAELPPMGYAPQQECRELNAELNTTLGAYVQQLITDILPSIIRSQDLDLKPRGIFAEGLQFRKFFT